MSNDTLSNDLFGVIQSPDYDADGKYDHNLDCRWTLVAKEHHVIFLWFEVFWLEYDSKCKNDFIKVSHNYRTSISIPSV